MTMHATTNRPSLVVPVYLDTNALLDLLASLEGGFTLVEKVTSERQTSSTNSQSVSAEFGVPNILSLLKVGLSGGAERARKTGSSESTEVERYHTYGSLLFRLRQALVDQGALATVDASASQWDDLAPSSFVELRGTFRPNPLLETFDRFDQLMGLYKTIAPLSPIGQHQKSGRPSPPTNPQGKMIDDFRKIVRDLAEGLRTGGILLFLIELAGHPNYRVVASIYSDYLRDRTLSEISHGDFWMLAKVVKNLAQSQDDAIDLLRSSALRGFNDEVLEKLLFALRQSGASGVSLPAMETKIRAPAMQVIPIAIYI